MKNVMNLNCANDQNCIKIKFMMVTDHFKWGVISVDCFSLIFIRWSREPYLCKIEP